MMSNTSSQMTVHFAEEMRKQIDVKKKVDETYRVSRDEALLLALPRIIGSASSTDLEQRKQRLDMLVVLWAQRLEITSKPPKEVNGIPRRRRPLLIWWPYAPAKRKLETSSRSALVVVIRDHGHALSVIL